MNHYTEANAEFQRLYTLPLEDAGLSPAESRNATATSQQSRPPWKPAPTTTWIAWTWGGDSRPKRLLPTSTRNPRRQFGLSRPRCRRRGTRLGNRASTALRR